MAADTDEPGDGWAARRADALARLAEGEPHAALALLRPVLRYAPLVIVDPERLSSQLDVLARVAVAAGRRELAEDAARAATDAHDPDALYRLGYRLVDEGLPAMAAGVLQRCLQVVPGSEQVVTELAAALERDLAHAEAARLLAAHPKLLDESFLCRYLLAFDAAMAGDLVTTRALAPRLAPAGDDEAFMAARVDALLRRADRVAGAAPLDAADLRGWHCVVTGGVLLHRSPHGFDDAMRGRFAWVQDTAARVRTGLERLAAALAAWGAAPDCVYAPPGREHEIVAEAAARRLGVPRVAWPAVGVPAPGLVVCYDLAEVAWRDLERLTHRRSRQVLYAHATRWTEDLPVAADLTTVLYQSIVSPWAPQLRAEGTGATLGPGDERPVDALAAELLADPGLDADEQRCDDPAGLAALLAAVGPPTPGRRERGWAGSPVPSARFL